MVDCTGLENRRTERYRGFESLPLRKKSGNNENCFLILFYTSGKLACRRSIKQNRAHPQSLGSPAKFREGQDLIPNNQNRFVLLSGNAV